MRRAVEAGIYAAERSGGLVDPTLVGEIEERRATSPRAPGWRACRWARRSPRRPPRRPAQPRPDQRWREFAVDDATGEVVRPPGLRFDTGGTGKGLAADMVAATLRGYSRFIVDCGGDIRIGGADALVHPYEVFVEHPITGDRAHVAAARLRRGRHLRDQRADLARRRRPLRPPPARPRHAASRPGPAWSAPPRSATPPWRRRPSRRRRCSPGPRAGAESSPSAAASWSTTAAGSSWSAARGRAADPPTRG